MPYRLVEVESNNFLISPLTLSPYEWDTGGEAQEYAKSLASTGTKYRVKKVADTAWRNKANAKFWDGTWEHLPWVSDNWWNDPQAFEIHQWHFPHPSTKEPGMIAFFENDDKGSDNILTRVKPGRYLEQFSKILRMYDLDLKATAARFLVIYEPRKLHIAKTEDEIQWVYENGPPSCMSTVSYRAEHNWGWKTKGKWPLDTHACRVYAHNDLQVAYVVNDDEHPTKKNSVAARAVIWPAKKTYSRVYGEELALKKLLQKEGYEWNSPLGAKIQRVPVDRSHFLCPYIDAGPQSGGGSLAVMDRGDHLEIVPNRTPHAYSCGSTAGATHIRFGSDGGEAREHICSYCGNGPTVEITPVFTSGTDHTWVCSTCINNERHSGEARFQRCQREGRYYDTAIMGMVEMGDGQRWSQRVFNACGFTCARTNKRWHRDYAVKILDKNELWHTHEAQAHAFRCEHSRYWYSNECKVEVKYRDGRKGFWGKSYTDSYTFCCAVCQDNINDPYIGGDNPRAKTGPLVCHQCATKSRPAGAAAVETLEQPNQRSRGQYFMDPRTGRIQYVNEGSLIPSMWVLCDPQPNLSPGTGAEVQLRQMAPGSYWVEGPATITPEQIDQAIASRMQRPIAPPTVVAPPAGDWPYPEPTVQSRPVSLAEAEAMYRDDRRRMMQRERQMQAYRDLRRYSYHDVAQYAGAINPNNATPIGVSQAQQIIDEIQQVAEAEQAPQPPARRVP